MGLKPEAASPSSVYRGTPRYGRVAALGSGCEAERSVPTAGGICVAAQGLLSVRRHVRGVQAAYPCLYPSFSLSDTVFRYRVSRRVSDRDGVIL